MRYGLLAMLFCFVAVSCEPCCTEAAARRAQREIYAQETVNMLASPLRPASVPAPIPAATPSRAVHSGSFDYDETPLADVLQDIATRADVSIILHKDVDKTAPITLRLQRVSYATALHWVSKLGKVQTEIRNGAVYVVPRTLKRATTTRVYDLRDIAFAVTDARVMDAEHPFDPE